MIPWTPHPFQKRGIQKLISQPGAGLLLDPGMGKTTTALGAFEVLREAGHAKAMLVVAPIQPMYDTWPKEAQKWADFTHLRVCVLHGPKKEERLDEKADIYVINPEGLAWYFGHKAHELPDVQVLCVDESTKFKNSQSKRFKLLKKYLHWFNYRWILTGTFSPNGLLDLFGQVYIMDQGASLGRYITHYKNEYFYQTGFGGYTWSPFNHTQEAVAEKIGPMVLKLDAEDYLDMPEFHKIVRPVTIPKAAMLQYKEIEKEFLVGIGSGTIVAANAAAAGTKCRQIANGAVYDEDRNVHPVHTAKLDALQSIVEETNGHPLLIYYEFDHDRERLMGLLGKDAVCLTGVKGTKLSNITQRFNKGKIPYLVCHPGSVHGMNVQGHCYHMVWFCVTWNLEYFIQAVWRLYRQGQGSSMVMCYLLVAMGTLDERVVQVLDHKAAEQDSLDNLLIAYGEENE